MDEGRPGTRHYTHLTRASRHHSARRLPERTAAAVWGVGGRHAAAEGGRGSRCPAHCPGAGAAGTASSGKAGPTPRGEEVP